MSEEPLVTGVSCGETRELFGGFWIIEVSSRMKATQPGAGGETARSRKGSAGDPGFHSMLNLVPGRHSTEEPNFQWLAKYGELGVLTAQEATGNLVKSLCKSRGLGKQLYGSTNLARSMPDN